MLLAGAARGDSDRVRVLSAGPARVLSDRDRHRVVTARQPRRSRHRSSHDGQWSTVALLGGGHGQRRSQRSTQKELRVRDSDSTENLARNGVCAISAGPLHPVHRDCRAVQAVLHADNAFHNFDPLNCRGGAAAVPRPFQPFNSVMGT